MTMMAVAKNIKNLFLRENERMLLITLFTTYFFSKIGRLTKLKNDRKRLFYFTEFSVNKFND